MPELSARVLFLLRFPVRFGLRLRFSVSIRVGVSFRLTGRVRVRPVDQITQFSSNTMVLSLCE